MPVQAATSGGNSIKTPPFEHPSDIAAGEVVVINDYPFIAEHDFPVGRGNVQLAIRNGIYRMVPAAAYEMGVTVFWDNAAKKVTNVAVGNVHLGSTASVSYDDDEFIEVAHAPQGVTGVIV